jgi:hypothetical protein
MAAPLQGQPSTGCRKTCGKGAKWTQILAMGYSTPRLALGQPLRPDDLTGGYCWSSYFKVLEVPFLGEISSAFLPSKKTC